MKSFEYSGVLFHGVTERAKHQIKNKKVDLVELSLHLWLPLVQPVISLVLKGISRIGVKRAGRGYMDKSF